MHTITRSLVLAYEGEPSCAGNNRYVAELARKHDWIVPLAFCPASAPALPRGPFAGISLFVTTRREADDFVGWPIDLLDRLSDAGSIVSVNAIPATLRRAAETLRRLEGCRVLISHLGQPPPAKVSPGRRDVLRILEPLLSLADAPNVGVKLSGFYSISEPPHAYPHTVVQPFVETVAERFGAERLYWGSDFSPALDHVSFAQTIDAVGTLPWSPSERSAVMGGNLQRLVASARAHGERA